jgi:hypothetical protein
MPIFLRVFANERAMRWIFEYQVELETSEVTSGSSGAAPITHPSISNS